MYAEMNTFGRLFIVSIFGESHGNGVGITLDGCPPGMPLSEDEFFTDMQRRKSGARGTTPRTEEDMPKILTGCFEGKTTGAPLTLYIENKNTRSSDYGRFREFPRPGHADFTAMHKYFGFDDFRGSGHFSGRLTSAITAAGVVAKKIIAPVSIQASILEIGGHKQWQEVLDQAIADHDSLGGLLECRVNSLPVGLGEPFFDSVEAVISHLIFSIPAVRAIEFGTGFGAARMRGSEHNDPIIGLDGTTGTNHAAGVNGGITNGNELYFRIAVKPTSSIGRPQETMHFPSGKVQTLTVEGRHDACISLRVPPVLEAMTAIGLADLWLMRQAQKPWSPSQS